MASLSQMTVPTMQVSIAPTSTPSHPSPKPSPKPSPVLIATAAPTCPFSRLAPAGTACPITGALAVSAASPPAAAAAAPLALSPAPTAASAASEVDLEEYEDAAGEELAVVVAAPRRRCPWWARLLRWSVKAFAKRAVMRSLRPVFRFGFGSATHMWRNVRRGETIASVSGGAASIIGGVVIDSVEGGECPLGFK